MTYPRQLEKNIIANMVNKRALFILGPRRVGKTTMLLNIREHYANQSPTLFFDLERHGDLDLFQNGIDHFTAYLETKNFPSDKRVIIFIDEIQHLRDFSNFIKLAVDHYSHRIKLILSGSSSAQILTQFKDSLAGRKFIFELKPLSFREFLLFKDQPDLIRLLGASYREVQPDAEKFYQEQFHRLYLEYLIYGGFPETVLTSSHQQKTEILKELIHAYVLKDIRNWFTIEKIDEFNRLIRLLALQSGGLLSLQSLSRESNLDMRTLKRYIRILKDTFIIDLLPPLYSNKRKELKKMPKIYLQDTGIRNALLDNFIPFESRPDRGELLETRCFSALKMDEYSQQNIYFWRTHDGKEVDFVLFQDGEYIPFEIKTRKRSAAHLRFFSQLYSSSESYLVQLEPGGEVDDSMHILRPWYL